MTPRSMLVSFCNQPVPSSSPLLYLQMSLDGSAEPVLAPVPLGLHGLTSKATGLARDADRIFVLSSSAAGQAIAVLSALDLRPIAVHALPETSDAHSMCIFSSTLYIVSTGTDEVFALEILENAIGAPRLVWKAGTERRDTHHVNSVVEFEGELIISAFGSRTGRMWDSATGGYLHNISRDVRLKGGIAQPHTLSVHNGRLFYCESRSGSFCSLESPICTLEGYSRGVAWLSDDLVALGTSIGRRISKSTGAYANPDDPGIPVGTCAVTVHDVSANRPLSQAELSWFGPEIYDVIPLDTAVDAQQVALSAHMAERSALGSLRARLDEDELAALRLQRALAARSDRLVAKDAQLTNLRASLAARDLELEHLSNSLEEIRASRSWKMGQLLARIFRWFWPRRAGDKEQ